MILRRIGGKKTIAEDIISMFPSDYTSNAYSEPYFGAGWIFWKKRKSRFEWINDIDLELMNFWQSLRDYDDDVINDAEQQIQHQEIMCGYLKQIREKPLTVEQVPDFKRAVQYMLVNKASFNGFVGNRNRVHVGLGCKVEPFIGAIPLLKGMAQRLEGTRITHQDALRFTKRAVAVKKINVEYTLHYLDPPFIGVYCDYPPEKWENVLEQVKLIDAAGDFFVLSINDHPLSRELAKEYPYEELSKFYSVAVDRKNGFHNELVIHNLNKWYNNEQTRLE